MLFKKLIFDNYKTYYGHQEINLYIPKSARLEEGKNLILIGGLNGSGKTTILKAILYVLFGKRGISQEEHSRLFANVINDTFFAENGRDCYVSLVLETDVGEEWELKVQWSFDRNKKLINENREIVVRKPGVTHGKVAKIDNLEVFNRFIDKRIPFHVAPFFIFDGEEIKGIILRQNSAEMKESIQKITGLEAHKQLLEDLISIKDSLEKKLAKTTTPAKLASFQREFNDISDKIEIQKQKEVNLLAEFKKIGELLDKTKQSRSDKLKQNSHSREVLVWQQSRFEAELTQVSADLVITFEQSVLPIILSSKIDKLKKRLLDEQECRNRKIIRETALLPLRNFMDALVKTAFSPPLLESQLVQIKEVGEQVLLLEGNQKLNLAQEFSELHDISNSEFNYLMNVSTYDKTKIIEYLNRIETLKTQVARLEFQLRDALPEVDITSENDVIDTLTKKLGEQELKLRVSRSALSKLTESKTQLSNQMTRFTNQGEDFETIKRQLIHVTRLINAVTQYVDRVTIIKTAFIREEFSSMLNVLMRKQGEFGKIEFDTKSYSIRLYNDREQEVSIQDRSAGEMQMIASALIWALTKVSDLSLPMVIDTPLGRLDSIHRDHLVKHYYRNLGDQIIILSTDTEITQDYVELMKLHSHRQYKLDYDQEKKYTIVRDGYFDFVKV